MLCSALLSVLLFCVLSAVSAVSLKWPKPSDQPLTAIFELKMSMLAMCDIGDISIDDVEATFMIRGIDSGTQVDAINLLRLERTKDDNLVSVEVTIKTSAIKRPSWESDDRKCCLPWIHIYLDVLLDAGLARLNGIGASRGCHPFHAIEPAGICKKYSPSNASLERNHECSSAASANNLESPTRRDCIHLGDEVRIIQETRQRFTFVL
ncbi:uncharacterized protein L969DRAFT_95021 [Mixia osmundae IAM 14324]|uniref:uncharacterized protein n=1 Tax=Mixia osmundae (strain CBS 9802 / IAM 14324 / JCM 22182 / KY 12970) TaxID=764103 RepID=UPI0004A54EAE|nr:uncharacterized protein L969DRAFT_95021 [Mixia osmundae IAM 14324]KEI38851.1 hypothetical protein L969DRAFT_95021 [Mixia osmundae IAM 14324]